MNRAEKIALIKAVAEGKISLRKPEPSYYIFFENQSKEGFFEVEGALLSKEEVDLYCREIKARRSIPSINGEKEPHFIFVLYERINPLHLPKSS